MPSWIIHIATANELTKKIKVNDIDEFIFGNVAPDILAGHIIENTSKVLPYEITHFGEYVDINGIHLLIPDLKKFKQNYKSNFNNPFVLGYYIHLITDYFWNEYSYRNHFFGFDNDKDLIKLKKLDNSEEIKTWDDAVAEKQKDFRIFTIDLQKKIEVSTNVSEDVILKDGEGFQITKNDITKTLDYLNNIKNMEIENGVYTMFDEQTLKNIFNNCIDFIVKDLMEEK